MLRKISSLLVLSIMALPAWAGVVQVGDFRIDATDYSSDTFIDPGVVLADDIETRAILAAPVQINSVFTATSQESGGVADANDLTLRTFSSVTRVRTLNRFGPDDDGIGGVQRAGGVQWAFDLSPLDSYLATEALDLTALDLDLDVVLSGGAGSYDFFLSYTSPTAGTTLTGIGAAGSDIYSSFVLPGIGAADGDIINGEFEVIAGSVAGNLDITESLLSLYDEGVREFNLILTSSSFMNGRNIDIAAGSGLSITTVPVPEPATMVLIGLGTVVMMGKRRK